MTKERRLARARALVWCAQASSRQHRRQSWMSLGIWRIDLPLDSICSLASLFTADGIATLAMAWSGVLPRSDSPDTGSWRFVRRGGRNRRKPAPGAGGLAPRARQTDRQVVIYLSKGNTLAV
jgi:hypothetical protein